MKPKYPKGSEWRKWDLHVHTKGTAKNDQFTSETFDKFCTILFKKALEKEIAVIGITDYFSIDNYKKVKVFISNIDTSTDFNKEEIITVKNILIIPNVELRMMPVTDSGRLVNVHCLFNPAYEDSLENNFFGSIEYSAGSGNKYKMNRQGLIDLGKSLDSSLNNEKAYIKGVDSFVVTHSDLQKLLDENSGFRENVVIAVSNSNRDGASAFQKHYDLFEDAKESSLDAVRKSIYCISNCIFSSNEEDIKYFSGQKKDDKELVIKKCGSIKPCIHGSDAHTEDKLFSPDQNRYCWIKADPTFEGLKQILYEPESGERVQIGPIKPDQKDEYRIIRKIKFNNASDFPEEIEFNKNLCSIIGSRSSGKSALLAYVAHSIDKKRTEEIKKGPGEGEAYHWNKITFAYAVEWDNGLSNDESPGKIIYIPQNYLFEKSNDPDEIKEKIAPVLFKVLPGFETRYTQTKSSIHSLNQQIAEQVDEWFALSTTIQSLDNTLKDLGDKQAVEKEKAEINSKIGKLKEKNDLSEDDIRNYQKITADISAHKNRIEQINTELLLISDVSTETNFFKTLKIMPSPALENLPRKLHDKIKEDLIKKELEILSEANKQVVSYKESIKKEKTETEEKISKINQENSPLIEKYHKNIELETLVHKINEHTVTIKKIDDTGTEKKNTQNKLNEYEKTIKEEIDQIKSLLKQLRTNVNNADQSSLEGIKFGIEYGFDDESLKIVTQKINIKEKSEFIENGSLKIKDIRENPANFLFAIYSGKQKRNAGNDKKEVSQEILTLTEKILFTAEMEGDKIGGFSEPTMTPGKRALFALRLILEESDDTWPLLIDQPEDDLDSRSVYAEIVPFLKKKKKERQIILVSHNANLVIGADSEQIIVANRNGDDRRNKDGKQFNYLTGSIEYTKEKVKDCEDTLDAQGVREHACEILDGGKTAFDNREKKYGFKS